MLRLSVVFVVLSRSVGFSLGVSFLLRSSDTKMIACWVVVFSPQIIENFRRSSAEGLSIEFIIIWLAGDFANIIGAVMQGVLPTMVHYPRDVMFLLIAKR